MSTGKLKLSAQQLALLNECCQYNISDQGKKYYRLGGHGYAPIRYNEHTLSILKQEGLVEYKSYWSATELGKKVAAELADKPEVQK